MRRLIVACAWSSWLLLGCGPVQPAEVDLEPTPATQTSIYAGYTPDPEAFPEVGALVLPQPGREVSLCTGTLIAPDTVLTAAHCVTERVLPNPSRAHFVPRPVALPVSAGRAYAIAGVRAHEGFDPRSLDGSPLLNREPRDDAEAAVRAELEARCGKALLLGMVRWLQCVADLPAELQRALGLEDESSRHHDVALAFLRRPARDIASPALVASTSAPAAGSAVTVVGYGMRNQPLLLGMVQQALAQKRAVSLPLHIWGEHEFETSAPEGAACSGDSGGPAFRETASGQRVLLGVTMAASLDPWGRCTGGNVFTRVDRYVSWIAATMRDACAAGLRDAAMCAPR